MGKHSPQHYTKHSPNTTPSTHPNTLTDVDRRWLKRCLVIS